MLQKLAFILITANVLAYFWFDYHAAKTSSQQQQRRQQIIASQAQPGHQPLYLQSEQPQKPVIEPASSNLPRCFSVTFKPVLMAKNGIEQREQTLHQIESALIAEEFEVQLAWRQTKVLRGYLIYLPPKGGALQAKSVLNSLKEQGIDAFMFSSGELIHGISLGLYQQRQGAEDAVQRFTQSGYKVELKNHYKLQRWPYLHVVAAVGLGDKQAQRQEHALQNITGNYADVLIASKPCVGVAPKAELE
jgi:hypothetical protein